MSAVERVGLLGRAQHALRILAFPVTLTLPAAMVATVTLPAAANVDVSTLSSARQLGQEGVEAYNGGRYPEALDKLRRAYAVVKAPSVGLWYARALVKMDQLVEASECYLEVTRLAITAGDATLQQEAKQAAANEREALIPRIPTLTLQVEGPPPDRIVVDGHRVAIELLGVPRPVNPGKHTVEVSKGKAKRQKRISLAEGARETVALELPDAPLTEDLPPPPPPANRGSTQRVLGWVGIGVGGAALITGTAMGLFVLAEDQRLRGCPGESDCPPDWKTRQDTFNAMRYPTTITLIGGGVLLGGGLALLLTAPRSSNNGKSVPRAALEPWLGVGSLGVTGRF